MWKLSTYEQGQLIGTRPVGTPSHWDDTGLGAIAVVEASKALDVSYYKLGLLLGVPFPKNVYRWVSGKHEMSSKYLARAFLLVLLKWEYGWTVDRMERIDWATFTGNTSE